MSQALAGIIALLGASAFVGPALSQTGAIKNPQVDIAYIAPRSEPYQAIYERLKALQVLEMLQEFLAPLRLPNKLLVKTDECGGAMEIPYVPQQPVTICYEYIREIEANALRAPDSGTAADELTKQGIIVGTFINLVLDQVAHAVFDMLQIPIWGRENDAADNVTALIMVEFRADLTWTMIGGTSWFLAERGFTGDDFSKVQRGTEAQRYFNYTCIAFGSNPGKFKFLVEDGSLPQGFAQSCPGLYRKLRRSFIQTMLPHIDQELLKQVRAIDWTTRLQAKRD